MSSWWKIGDKKEPVDYAKIPLTSNQGDDSEDEELFNGDAGQSLHKVRIDDGSALHNGYRKKNETDFKQDHKLSLQKKLCLVFALLLGITIVIFFYFSIPCSKSQDNWAVTFEKTGTESCVRLYDVNNDGVVDMIFGVTIETGPQTEEEMEVFCKERGDLTPPCGGKMIALDGKNGAELWRLTTDHEIFEISCGNIDINQDGIMDCIGGGRGGSFFAVNPKTGEILWKADKNVTNNHWNYYQPQIIPDLDSDGVPDIVVTHGGDFTYSDEDTERLTNFIVLVSGASGNSFGFMEVPDHHETYSPPVLYTQTDGSIYVLFGSGGETIQGSLWAISLKDLYHNIVTTSTDPLTGDYKQWGKSTKQEKGFIELLRSETNSGVMVPVVIADMNNDGIDDIIVSLFDATVTVLDGQTLEIIWTTDSRFQGLQFYTTPALGYFNDDDVLDLMISMSYGKYPVYNLTMHVVLDGENGDILWNLKSSKSTWSSPLTLQTGNHKDAFLFWVQGRQGNIIDYELKDSIGRVRRHGGKEEAEENDDDDKDSDPDIHEQDCDVPEAEFISEMLLMNRNTIRNPIRVVQENSVKHMYSVKYSNVLGMGQEDMDKMRLKMQNSTDEQKMNMTIKMINQVKALSESDERIVTDVMNHISEEDLAKLKNHVMEFLGGVLKSGDDIYTVMTHHVMHHVLHMEESHGGDGDMPSSSAEGEPDSHPEGMPNEHGHGHAHNDDMPMGGEHGHNDDDMPMAGQHSHDDDMPMGAGEHHDDDDDDMPMAGQHSHDDMPMGGGKHHDDDMPMVGQHSHDDDMPMGGGKHHGDDDDDDDMPMASPENTDSDSMPMQPGKMPIDEDNIPMNSEAKPDLQEPAPEPSSTVLTPRINGTDINSIKLNSSNTNNTAAPPLISEKHTTPKLLHRYKKPLPAYPHRLPYTKYKLPGHSRHARHGGSEEEHGDMGEMEETISEIIVNPNGAMCARMVMDIKPTGAVGMVDGQLNYFFLENWIAYYRDFGGSIKGGDYKVIARKINLNTAIQQKDTIKLDKHLSIGESIHSVDTMDESEESFSFLPNGLQSWLSYMGGNGDGHFKHV